MIYTTKRALQYIYFGKNAKVRFYQTGSLRELLQSALAGILKKGCHWQIPVGFPVNYEILKGYPIM